MEACEEPGQRLVPAPLAEPAGGLPERCERWHESEADEVGGKERCRYGECERPVIEPQDPLARQEGDEGHQGGHEPAQDREGDLGGAPGSRVERADPLTAPEGDRLHDHDCAVHQQSEGHGQSAEGEHVDAVSGKVDSRHGKGGREEYRAQYEQIGSQGGIHEDEHGQYGRHAEEGAPGQAPQVVPYALGAVLDQLEPDPRRKGGPQLVGAIGHPVGDAHRAAPRYAVYLEAELVHPVVPEDAHHVLGGCGIDAAADIAQAHGAALPQRDDDLLEVLHA